MTDLKQAAEMALEALEDIFGKEKKDVGAINALRQALAQHVDNVYMSEERVHKTEKSIHEPVAWMKSSGLISPYKHGSYQIPLYTAPPKREWVGLTDEEIESELTKEFAQWWSRHVSVCRAIEAKLKEKNHD